MSAIAFDQLVMQGVRSINQFKPPMELANLGDIIKLDSNESMLGASPKAIDAMIMCAANSHRYPETTGSALKQALSRYTGADESWITLGNGSNDILDIIARTFCGPGDEIIFSQYAFAVYPIVTKLVGATPVQIPATGGYGHDLRAMAEAVTEKTKVIFIANPNNPTGTWNTKGEIESFLAKVPPRVIVVLDEAYIEYCTEPEFPNGLDYLAEYPNVVVTRTFSKARGLAALRVGYAVCDPEITNYLNRVRQPFNVNKPALAAAEAALGDDQHLERTVQTTHEGMQYMVSGLEVRGIGYIPSRANFICIDVGDAVNAALAMRSKGILVTPLANYGMTQFIRVTIGTTSENESVMNAIEQCTLTN